MAEKRNPTDAEKLQEGAKGLFAPLPTGIQPGEPPQVPQEQKKAGLLRTILTPPVFSDLSKQRVASLQHKVVLGFLVAMFLGCIALFFSWKGVESIFALAILIFQTALFILTFFWLRRGYLGWVSFVLVGVIYGASLAIWPLIGFGYVNVLVFALVIALAGLVLKPLRVAMVTGLVILTIVFALPYISVPQTEIGAILLLLGFEGVLLTVASSTLEHSFAEVDRSTRSMLQANKDLQDLTANLEERVAERTRAAEIARLDAEIARHEAESQVWFTSGQAQLSEKMRGEQSIEMLADNVTNHLCQYLGAQTGAFFLVSGQRLKLTGRYAYTEHTGQKDEFGFGENLVGEAARANRIISVISIPDDAPLVASALGDAKPNQLLIAPIGVDGQVFGVVELATLNQFSAEHESFLRRSSESIAIAFRTAQARERIASLLADSQRQTEELQAQEEELRAANEELQAQAESRAPNEVPANRRQSARPL